MTDLTKNEIISKYIYRPYDDISYVAHSYIPIFTAKDDEQTRPTLRVLYLYDDQISRRRAFDIYIYICDSNM